MCLRWVLMVVLQHVLDQPEVWIFTLLQSGPTLLDFIVVRTVKQVTYVKSAWLGIGRLCYIQLSLAPLRKGLISPVCPGIVTLVHNSPILMAQLELLTVQVRYGGFLHSIVTPHLQYHGAEDKTLGLGTMGIYPLGSKRGFVLFLTTSACFFGTLCDLYT